VSELRENDLHIAFPPEWERSSAEILRLPKSDKAFDREYAALSALDGRSKQTYMKWDKILRQSSQKWNFVLQVRKQS